MTLPELSIKRHVLAWMLSAVLVLFGIISYQRISVDRFPEIEFPIITVTTTLRGANPDIVDASITSVIESAINTTPGIEHIQSSSSPGASVIVITFKLEKDINVAYNEVQANINTVLRRLPTDTDPPILRKAETNAEPILWLALTGDRTIQQLNLFALNTLKKKLETIDGVGEVQLGGRRDRNIRIELKPERMNAYNLTTSDIIGAFDREHVQVPGGFLVSKNSERLLKLDLEFHRLDALAEMIVAYRNGASIKLKEVAEIKDDLTDFRQIARYNSKPTVGLGIIKIANANTVDIIKEVERRLDADIRPNLPAGLNIDISANEAPFIEEMVASLQQHLLEGTLFAALIVLLFMRSFSSTLMICLEIPVSLLGAIAIMYFAGYTFNSMTLLALLLLIGVVVDDAIVVRESIIRHISGDAGNKLSASELKDPRAVAVFRTKATEIGSREVTFAVIASSLSLVCIFAPVIFMDGIIGKFFEAFAVVVTAGVLISLFVSLTLTPMLSSRYLPVTQQHGKLYHRLGQFFNAMENQYRQLIIWVLNHRWKVLFATLLVILSSVFFFKNVEKEFVPEADEGRFNISFKTPLGSSINYTNTRMDLIEKVLLNHTDDIKSFFTVIGSGQQGQVNQGRISVRLKDKHQRKNSQAKLVELLKVELAEIPGVRAFPVPASMVRGQRSEKLQFNITGPNIEKVSQYAKIIQQELSEIQGIGKVDLDVQLDLPQLTMHIDRARAASFGLSATDIASAVNVYAGGVNVAKFNDENGDGQRYDIRLKSEDGHFAQAADLSKIYLRSSTSEGNGSLVRLDSIASFKPILGPAVIGRYDLQYAANLYASPTMPLGEAVEHVDRIVKKILPGDYKYKLSGQAEEFAKTFKNVGFIFMLALILLYMVLASQFNSFLQPLIIMVAQPLAIIGGVFALWVTGNSLNIFSMIGMVLLIGLVAKNSILLVDLTNQLREKGHSINDALKEACPVRLRPVLMTSLTIILALLPAAFGLGAGAETNGPLSVAVIGGMISSTLLTLVVVPATYSLLMSTTDRFGHKSISRD
ncbi:MAG: efflux RND transporter permease subunit [Methylophilaceae bacterium]